MYKFLKIIRVENTESSTKKWIRTYLPLAQFVSKVLNGVVKLGHLPTIVIVRYILKIQAKTSKIENQQKWNHL